MNRIKHLFQKDKFGLVRGTFVLGFALLMIAAFFLLGVFSRDSIKAEERAANAVRQVAQQFQVLVEDGFRQMNVAAEEISANDAENQALIVNLVRYGVFSDAMLISDGVEYHMDGTRTQAAQSTPYIRYRADDIEGKIVAGAENQVQLRVSTDSGVELAAWLDPQRLERTLGSAFEGTYGYAIFNSATGAYLVNRSNHEDGGYYDALMKLNIRGRTEKLLSASVAQAQVKSSSVPGKTEYIAQTSTSIFPWSVALFIPEDLIAQENNFSGARFPVLGVAALLLIAALIAYAGFIMRRMRIESKVQQGKFRIAERMLALSSKDAKVMLYLYDRKSDNIRSYCDGLKLNGNDACDAPKNLMELTGICGLNESDAEQLRERIWDLKPGEHFGLNLISSGQEDKHLLRFVLSCLDDEKDLVIGTVRNFTMEQQAQLRFSDERNFRKAILPKTISVWEINLSRNRWMLTDCRARIDLDKIGIVLNAWRDFEADFNAFVRDYVHPKDYPDYVSKMSAEVILDMYSKGMSEHILEYRVRSGESPRYEWHRHIVRVFKNPDSGEIFANMYVLNVDAEKNAEIERKERTRILQQTLTALGGIYYGLYYIDLDGDLCYAARTHGNELITQLNTPFRATFADYIAQNVHPEDQNALRQLFDPYTIRKNIREGSHFMRCEYRRRIGDGYEWSAAMVQAARFENGTVRDVVIALRNINGERRQGD